MEILMMDILVDAFLILMGVAAAYVAFVTLAIALARAIFPKIEIDDEEMAGDSLTKMKSKVHKLQSRLMSSSNKATLSEGKRMSRAGA